MLEFEGKAQPKYKQPNSFGAYVMLLIGLAIAGLIAYYAFSHKEHVSRLWYQATHRDSASAPIHPDQ